MTRLDEIRSKFNAMNANQLRGVVAELLDVVHALETENRALKSIYAGVDDNAEGVIPTSPE